jgi:hypothetical protein
MALKCRGDNSPKPDVLEGRQGAADAAHGPLLSDASGRTQSARIGTLRVREATEAAARDDIGDSGPWKPELRPAVNSVAAGIYRRKTRFQLPQPDKCPVLTQRTK